MIIQRLYQYYQRLLDDPDSGVAGFGFERKEIPFLIEIDHNGSFLGFIDTRTGEGKKRSGRVFLVPKGEKKTSGVKANLLWDTPNYVLGISKKDTLKDPDAEAIRSQQTYEAFQQRFIDFFPESFVDTGINAIRSFYSKQELTDVLRSQEMPEIQTLFPIISFKLAGDTGLICQRPDVFDFIAKNAITTDEHTTQCLVTGEMDVPATLHTAIKGVWGATSCGANIVSFNLSAFESFGKKQGDNAPIGKTAEFGYTTALNHLLGKESKLRIQIADASTVFWSNMDHQIEDIFGAVLGESKGIPSEKVESMRAMIMSYKTGLPLFSDDCTPFHVLGLAPNAGRISIRFWYDGTVSEIVSRLREYFSDCEIVHHSKEPDHLSLFRLLVNTAAEGKADNIVPNVAGETIKSIMEGTPFPRSLLSGVIRRIRAEHLINHPRASLIKAILVRENRLYNSQRKEIGMSLDPMNYNPGYLLGRLFAVLERIQETANPGIDATIRDRFYGAASSTPVAAFPHLLKLKNHHISKMENKGYAINLEKLIQSIMQGIDDMPKHLDLADQGRFAIGYYHQRHDLFSKKDSSTKEKGADNE